MMKKRQRAEEPWGVAKRDARLDMREDALPAEAAKGSESGLSRSEAAKLRGATGFLHPARLHVVRAGGRVVFTGMNAREAGRAVRRWRKFASEGEGWAAGREITHHIDGSENHKTHHHERIQSDQKDNRQRRAGVS